jgi:hypothetical protein
VSNLSSRGIFLSYRRADAAPYALLLQRQLKERFPDARVFMDLDTIEPGQDFAAAIQEAVASCMVMVVLIGRQWATLADEQGQPRLDNPDDWVRFEIRAALERGVRLVPVLVDNAEPLRPQQLPAELHQLARLNALELSYGRYEYDANRMLDAIHQELAGPGTGTVDEAAQKDPQPVESNQDRVTRVLGDAARAAQSITGEAEKAAMLADVARVLATVDPVRATPLFADAERTAQSIISKRAKTRALAGVARALATVDPVRATRLFSDAEHAARSMFVRSSKASLLADVAKALATTDPDHAERIAQSINFRFYYVDALVDIAKVLAATDPARAAGLLADAENTAQAIEMTDSRASALASVAKALAATDPDHAERIAQSITDEGLKAGALLTIAEAQRHVGSAA